MPILTIRHLTSYHYRQPVAFGEHRMMLRPRDDGDQTVLESELEITPRPSHISWSRDRFGNHVATAHFTKRARELRFESRIRLDHAPVGFRADDIEPYARRSPFSYAPGDRLSLEQFIGAPSAQAQVRRFARSFLDADGSADTHALLVGMTDAIWRNFNHTARYERGVYAPAHTLELKSGSCRDLAVLMIAALRCLGIAARFVSGYLHLPNDGDNFAGGNTHAWVQVFVPGPGWIDFDPSSGMIGNQNLVRVAAVPAPEEAIPLQGSWIGVASDHLAMNVAVKVKAVRDET
jgi:transglutaminase-like putative cysteine protease